MVTPRGEEIHLRTSRVDNWMSSLPINTCPMWTRLALMASYLVLLSKKSITVLNTPGTIDADYRGEIKVILINLGKDKFTVKKGDRIAQMVVCPVVQVQLEDVQELSLTNRGVGGFGSTGAK